jgi:hypothetical protein
MRRIGAILCAVFVFCAMLVGAPTTALIRRVEPCKSKCQTPCIPNAEWNCVCTDVEMNCEIYCNLPAACE